MIKKRFRLERTFKWLVIISVVVAAIFAIRGLDLDRGALIGFFHRVSELPRQTRINALLKGSIQFTVDRVVERPSVSIPGAGIGSKRVTVHFSISCQKDLPFAVVPNCFTLVDSQERGYHPLTSSILFAEEGEEFLLHEGDELESVLFFQIPKDAIPLRIRFNMPR